MKKSDKEWREQLTPEQFEICRRKGTEPPFSGEYHSCKEPGTYHCSCCGAELFSSDSKYDSGSGWPSFFQPLSADGISTAADWSHGMHRTELLCSQCGAHLGHLFDDGPQPTGQRYCINSRALKLERRE